MPSFDVVSKVDWAEFNNALVQAQREIAQRFDFKGTGTSIEKNDSGVVIQANDEGRAEAAYVVLIEKLVRRKVSLKHLDRGNPIKNLKGARLDVKVKEGIETEKAKEIVKLLKDSKMKVQAAIQEDTVRVTGKKRDDLQEAIALLRGAEQLGLNLQFVNFRE